MEAVIRAQDDGLDAWSLRIAERTCRSDRDTAAEWLLLRFGEGLKVREIAEVLEEHWRSRGAAHRALATLGAT